MMLYLTTDDNNGVFDFLDEEGFHAGPIKKYIGKFDLLLYLKQTLRNVIGYYEYIAVDLAAVMNEDDETVEALKQFLLILNNSRLLIFVSGRERGDRLLMDLIDAGIYNIITGTTVNEVRKEIKACVSMEGMSYTEATEKYFISGEKKKEEGKYFVPVRKQNLIVAVAGTAPGAGVTHTAFNILSFLHSTNAHCAYCDSKNKAQLQAVADFFPDFVRRDYFWERDGCHYYGYGDSIKEQYDFIVIDMGILTEAQRPYLEKAAVSILCSKTKPWELPPLADKAGLLIPGKTDLLYICGSLANRQQLTLTAGDAFRQVHFADYSPDLWDGKTNAETYRKIFGMNIMEMATPADQHDETEGKKKKKKSFFKKNR